MSTLLGVEACQPTKFANPYFRGTSASAHNSSLLAVGGEEAILRGVANVAMTFSSFLKRTAPL